MTPGDARPAASPVRPTRLDHEQFLTWYKDYVARREQLQVQSERVRSELRKTREALRATLENLEVATRPEHAPGGHGVGGRNKSGIARHRLGSRSPSRTHRT